MSLPQLGKGNLLAKMTPSRMRHLTAIRGSDSLSVAKQDEGFRDGDVSGAFFFCRYGSFRVLRVRGSRICAALERRIDLGQLIDEIRSEVGGVTIVDREADLILCTLDARNLLSIVRFDDMCRRLLRTADQGLQHPFESGVTRAGQKSRIGNDFAPFRVALLHERRQLLPTRAPDFRRRANSDDELLWKFPGQRNHRRQISLWHRERRHDGGTRNSTILKSGREQCALDEREILAIRILFALSDDQLLVAKLAHDRLDRPPQRTKRRDPSMSICRLIASGSIGARTNEDRDLLPIL